MKKSVFIRVNPWPRISASKSWDNCRYPCTVLAISLAKARFQFPIFHSDHHRAGDDCEYCQHIQRDQPRSDAPADDLAEMPEINGMTHARANANRDQLLAM